MVDFTRGMVCGLFVGFGFGVIFTLVVLVFV